MSRYFSGRARALIYLCYFLPAILGVCLLIYALVPHLWFVYEGDAYSTMNLFELQGNAWEFYDAIIAGEVEDTEAARWFSQLLPIVGALFWILPIWYGVVAAAVAISAIIAFSFDPTSRYSNRTKRILQLICPNRICYLLMPLLPLFSALFPHMLLWFYHYQGMKMTLHAELLQDWILVLAAALINAIVYILLLPLQSELHMDLFRVYKSKKQVEREAREP